MYLVSIRAISIMYVFDSFFFILQISEWKMTLSTEEVIDACQVLARQSNLKLCVKQTTKGAAIAGLTAFAGGLVLGPVGIAIGLIVAIV